MRSFGKWSAWPFAYDNEKYTMLINPACGGLRNL
jgi:hypothetical protein